MNILVIDSCKESRYEFKTSAPESYAVMTLSSIKEALAYIQCHSFDAVILSIDDSKANEAITFLRLVECYAVHPFVAVALIMTDSDLNNDLLLDSGFASVVKKPVSPGILLKVVERHGMLKVES